MITTISTSPRPGRTWDSAILAAAPSTPSARFSQDVTSGAKARAWVEEVIGRRLPEGDFAAAFKDGIGLCELVNVLKPGTIAPHRIERGSTSPFHQMANISCFLQACRALGVREQVLFETLVSKLRTCRTSQIAYSYSSQSCIQQYFVFPFGPFRLYPKIDIVPSVYRHHRIRITSYIRVLRILVV